MSQVHPTVPSAAWVSLCSGKVIGNMSGFVTSFDVETAYLSQFDQKVVGEVLCWYPVLDMRATVEDPNGLRFRHLASMASLPRPAIGRAAGRRPDSGRSRAVRPLEFDVGGRAVTAGVRTGRDPEHASRAVLGRSAGTAAESDFWLQ